MNEHPARAGLVVRLLVALPVVGLLFGGGVLVGWATRERKAPARSQGDEAVTAKEARREIAACRKELRELAKEQIAPPVVVSPEAAPEEVAKVEALRREVLECRVQETLQNAYVCAAIRDGVSFYDVLVSGTRCADPPGIGEHLLNSVDKCAEFNEFPAHLDNDELTRVENERVALSQMSHAARTRDTLTGTMKRLRLECRRIWALPPE